MAGELVELGEGLFHAVECLAQDLAGSGEVQPRVAGAAGAEGIALVEGDAGVFAQPLGGLGIASEGGIGKV